MNVLEIKSVQIVEVKTLLKGFSAKNVELGLWDRMVEEKGFIPEFRDFILAHIPTSHDWAESIAISLLSTAVGGNRFVRSKIGPLKLNLWFLMIGPSGIAHKSTPMNYFVYPVLRELTEYVDYKPILPGRFSIEGFIEYLSQNSQGCIVRDEFTTLFKETVSKDYLVDILEFFSELYDGTMQKRYTRKAKLEESTSVYVNFLGATTPYIYRLMKPDFFVQGTGNRILFNMFEGLRKEILDETAEEFFYDRRQDALRNERVAEYGESLGGMHKHRFEQLVPMAEAGKLWINYRNKIIIESNKLYEEDPYNLRYTYMMRLAEFALKLSALQAISRVWQSSRILNNEELPIMEEDMMWAIAKTENYFSNFRRLLNEWNVSPLPTEPRTLGDPENAVLGIIESFPEGMPWREMSQKVKWRTFDKKEVLLSLYNQEKILFVISESTDQGGRKATLIFSKTNEKNIKGDFEIIGWDRFAYRTHLKTAM